MNHKVLYIEDEPFLGKIVKETLGNQGFDVVWESDGAKVMGKLTSHIFDICVLDIMLPNLDGYTLCRQIRKLYPALPVIFLTAKVETSDLVKGFDAGGNDYMRKPFSIEELIIRIKYQIQLNGTGKDKQRQKLLPDEIKLGRYRIFPKRFEMEAPSGMIRLSNRDMEVLGMLASNCNRVTDRKELLLNVWGDDSYFNSRNLDVYMRKLRKYFREDSSIEILTLKSKGYLFRVPEKD